MRTNTKFAPSSPDAIDHLVAAHPFALVISANGDMPLATPLPLLLERSSDGTATLIGHFPRTHPHTELLRRDPRALVVFMGSHGYISPSWLADRTQAPTWNYETAQLEINVEFDDSTDATEAALARLVEHMEHGRPNAWSIADMGPRYAKLAGAVVAFRAHVTAVHMKFKLGQDERSDVRADILAGLADTGQQPLLEAMTRENCLG
ncbi:FMN-binding negative transcriptional regulator [Lysobacter sp. CFH 32150]|uniref:FMN-binding negative transcriptional regulator n=1 Tax=Lysobacter sp. CFH 32150 TaxID=2927128 RepID=UPI001FA7EDC7|nr:FMN-binding negative transcriptional regulator [Lysobacter sp. CFH 32150]MCI4568493.1 FMN-binding negative transcriptional regulator [Lysobacter sp. CFH 32150]